MSVLKRKRKESQFEVIHHFYQVRRKVTDFLLRDFGYDYEKFEKKMNKGIGDRSYEELDENEKRMAQKKGEFNL